MTQNTERQQNWLQEVHDHPETGEEHDAAAAAMLADMVVPPDHTKAADELVRLRLAAREPGGQYTSVDAETRKWMRSHPSWTQ
ncbi:hypothetical protein [Mycolicibacterium tusciae]|uniref:Uncharacterized protein n=1 Tax=Mycolicibacterium tusciae TaxID=75922 RepID=A0A1X0JW60_9MYCO|nr:hypothetical protein [Mycolicibacterium tusciae]ORB66940.1 hypothetical protein BST47_07695 [Mycolicibacterium tusciae]